MYDLASEKEFKICGALSNDPFFGQKKSIHLGDDTIYSPMCGFKMGGRKNSIKLP